MQALLLKSVFQAAKNLHISMDEPLTLGVRLNLRTIFYAWAYYMMEKMWGKISSPPDSDGDLEDIYVQNPIMRMRRENTASTNDNQ